MKNILKFYYIYLNHNYINFIKYIKNDLIIKLILYINDIITYIKFY